MEEKLIGKFYEIISNGDNLWYKLQIKQDIIQLIMVIALITRCVPLFPLYKIRLPGSHVLPRRLWARYTQLLYYTE